MLSNKKNFKNALKKVVDLKCGIIKRNSRGLITFKKSPHVAEEIIQNSWIETKK